MKYFKILALTIGLVLICGGLVGQKKLIASQAIPELQYNDSLYSTLQWRLVGPFRGGRAGTVCGVAGDRDLFYMGTAGGGVWRTQDGGQTWGCISDGFFGGSIGAVEVSQSDPNVIYVGEGEQTLRGNVSSGHGMWRSTDAGTSWKYIGLDDSEHIGRIRVHPQNPDLVYVAAIGNLWKPNDMRGVYRSKDGGKNWERILFESDKAGAVDLILDPNNPRILYASTWEMKRNGYRMDSGGPGSHLWKSTDGGNSWVKLTNNPGMPKGTIGIIGISVSPHNSDRLYANIEAEEGGVFRSDDAGKTWRRTSDNRELRQRAWYYTRIYADSKDENIVYVANVGFWRSTDGGVNFKEIDTPHGDHHDLWIDPNDNQRMIIADDGGAQVSYDAGINWTTYHNQPTAQFYRVTTDNHFPFRIYGAQQDNSTVRILHRTDGNAIDASHWEPSAGGESAHLAPDPLNPDIVYGGTYKGYMMRLDHSTGQERSVNVWPDNPAGSGAEVMKYRFNWNFPVFFSPHNPKKLYATSNHVHVSYNEGQSWEVISPDLTRADPETIRSSGGPITQDNTGAEYYANIFAITESPLEEGVIYSGSDDGLLYISRDGGKNWKDITPKGSPRLNMMNCIDVSHHDKGTVYLAATSYKFGDYTPYLYKSNDYGNTWQLITKGIPATYYARTIRADHKRPGLLYAGTEWGMYISFDDGASWKPFQLNLPITSIRDLHIRDNMLIAATHGRSFWMIDDLTPLQELNDQVAAKSAHLFGAKPAYRLAQGGWGRANLLIEGENHPNGVLLHYFIREEVEGKTVKIEILETDGTPIQTYSSKPKEGERKLSVQKGGNRLIWDMRYPGFKDFPGMVLYSSPNIGPKAVPGKYVARLTIENISEEMELGITADPRLNNTQEDYQRQFDFLISVRDKVSEAHQAIRDIRGIRTDLDYLSAKLSENPEGSEIVKMCKELDEQMSVIENNIHQTKNKSQQDPLNYGIRLNNRLAFLLSDQQRGDFPPTDQAIEFRDEITMQLNKELKELDQLVSEGLKAIESAMQEKGISLFSNRTKTIKP